MMENLKRIPALTWICIAICVVLLCIVLYQRYQLNHFGERTVVYTDEFGNKISVKQQRSPSDMNTSDQEKQPKASYKFGEILPDRVDTDGVQLVPYAVSEEGDYMFIPLSDYEKIVQKNTSEKKD